ncbi:haeIIM [Symbiodinium microadriaticum]|nr:haeIIM [Symbiodinium microadriaticum]
MSVIGYQRVTSVRSLQSNLQLIIQYLSSLGYATVYEKLKATDYGLPQRRNRIYFFGVRDSHELAEKKEDILSKVSDRLEEFLLDGDIINAELASVTLVYEDEAVCFAQLWNERSSKDIAYMDVSQSIGRMPTSDAKVLPTILPGSKLWCMEKGSELLQLQGFDMDVYDELEITEHQRADLAGNSFAWPCITAAVLALISALRWNTASEDEELDELASMQSRPQVSKPRPLSYSRF